MPKRIIYIFLSIFIMNCTTYYKVIRESVDYSGSIKEIVDYNINFTGSYNSYKKDRKSALKEEHPYRLTLNFSTNVKGIDSLKINDIKMINNEHTKTLNIDSIELEKFTYKLKFDGTRSEKKRIYYYLYIDSIDFDNIKLEVEVQIIYKNGNIVNDLIICEMDIDQKIYKTSEEYQSLMGI